MLTGPVFDVGHISILLLFELFLDKSFGRAMDLHYCNQFIFKINVCGVKLPKQHRDAYVTYVNIKKQVGKIGF